MSSPMKDAPIPFDEMSAVAISYRAATAWAEQVAQGGSQRPGEVAVASEVVKNLRARGYSLTRIG